MSLVSWHELPLPADVAALEWPIKRAALRVHRALGPGFREAIYQRALAHALRQSDLRVREQVWIDVTYEELRFENAARVDMIVEDRVILELKAAEGGRSAHRLQLLSYLRAAGKPLGMLFNFHADRILREGHDRVVHPKFLMRSGHGTDPLPSGPEVRASKGPSRPAGETAMEGARQRQNE